MQVLQKYYLCDDYYSYEHWRTKEETALLSLRSYVRCGMIFLVFEIPVKWHTTTENYTSKTPPMEYESTD